LTRGQSFDSAIFKRRFREGEREIEEANIGGKRRGKRQSGLIFGDNGDGDAKGRGRGSMGVCWL
jgi:hypothetical protein